MKTKVDQRRSTQRVELGATMMDSIPGKHFTFVDPNIHDHTDRMVNQALRLIRGFERKGVSRERVIISVGVIHLTTPPRPRL